MTAKQKKPEQKDDKQPIDVLDVNKIPNISKEAKDKLEKIMAGKKAQA